MKRKPTVRELERLLDAAEKRLISGVGRFYRIIIGGNQGNQYTGNQNYYSSITALCNAYGHYESVSHSLSAARKGK